MMFIKILQISQFVIYSIAIIYFSNQPQAPNIVNIFWGFDKILHLSAYLLYYISSIFFINGINKSLIKSKLEIYSILLSALFAISDEFHQYFIPGRSAEFGDILADIIGILLGFTICRFFILKLPLFETGKR